MSRILVILLVLAAAIGLFVVLATRGPAQVENKKEENKDPGSKSSEGSNKILRLAIDTEPKTLDPIGITDTISDGVARKVHNTLVRFKKVKEGDLDKLVVEPDLAEKWELSPDNKLYTFTLRKGVKFHNDREIKAQDAVYSLTRLLSPESKRPDWLKPMVVGSDEFYKDNNSKTPLGIKVTGEYTLTVELTAPFAPFIQHLCTSNCAIVPREAVEDKSKPFARNPVGAGAFRLAEWKTNEMLRFTRNDAYYRRRPKLSEVRFYIVKDPNTRMEKFFGGELDASDIPYGRVKEAVQKAGEEDTLKYTTFRTNYIGIGMPNGNFSDKADLKPFGTNKQLRQAINYALDRDYLCDTVLEGRGIPAKGVLPPGMDGFKERPGWPRDVKKAKALMAEAGYPKGDGLPVLTILHRNDENTKKIAQSISHDLDEIGMKNELQAREWNSFLEMVEIEPRQMFLLGWVADYPDPDNFLYVLFHSGQHGPPGNQTWYSNPKVDALTQKARLLPDMKARAPLYQEAEDQILEDSPWICTYHVINLVLLRKELKVLRRDVTPLDTGTEFPQVDFAYVDFE